MPGRSVKSGPDKASDCGRSQANVELETTAKINGLVMGLATASDTLGRKIRRAAFQLRTKEQPCPRLPKEVFRQKGVAASSLKV